MEERDKKIKISPSAFAQDFVQNVPHNELAEKYGLNPAQLERLIALLQEKRYLTDKDISERKKREATASLSKQVDQTPFAILRGRLLLVYLLMAVIASIFYGGFISTLFLGCGARALSFVIFSMVFYAVLALLIRGKLSQTGLPLTAVFGAQPTWSVVRRHLLLVFPLFLVSLVSIYLLYYPLSYVAPEFVTGRILDSGLDFCTRDSPLTNLLSFLIVVLVGPILEEFVFRGLLFTRWSLKWNVPRAILLSSLVFAVAHADIIGSFFIGYVLCVVYVRTRSLYVPICIHVANNALVWIIQAFSVLAFEPDTKTTLAEFQSYWWLALIVGTIVLPWVIIFVKRHYPSTAWRVPYLSLRESTPAATGSPALA